MARIEIEHVTKHYGKLAAVHDLSLEIRDGEFVTLLGPSGCGKTTTLRMLAGFIRPDEGRILVDGQLLSSPEGVVPPERRNMGMVFQNYAVWPHKTVLENVAFGLRVRRIPRAEVEARVRKMLALVGLAGMEGRYPSQLSGGQQQRVALARSLVVEPSILLLDEPLSNLDAKLRERMRWELKDIQRRIGITFVYVTHDQAEAMALSDRVAVMHLGKLHQHAPAREVYQRPVDRVVADFMGLVNLVPAKVLRPGSAGRVRFPGGMELSLPLPETASEGEEVLLAVRPENIRLSRVADGEAVLRARVEESTFLGNMNDYRVGVNGIELRVQAHPSEVFERGQEVFARLDLDTCAVVRQE